MSLTSSCELVLVVVQKALIRLTYLSSMGWETSNILCHVLVNILQALTASGTIPELNISTATNVKTKKSRSKKRHNVKLTKRLGDVVLN